VIIKHVGYCDGQNHNYVESKRFHQLFHITLPASQKQFCQVVRVRPVHSLKVSKFSSDVICHHILQ